MYGMMLPSGNDAAQALALYFGTILIHNGQVDPNSYLTEVRENVVEDRLKALKTEPLPSLQVVPENETVEQRKARLQE